MNKLGYAVRALVRTIGPMLLLMLVLTLFVGAFFGFAFAVAWALGVNSDSVLTALTGALVLFGLCSLGWDLLHSVCREYRRLKEADELAALDEVRQQQIEAEIAEAKKGSIL